MTAAQQRYLDEIVAAGTKRYNGRARVVLEALEAAGYITVDWDLILHARGDCSWVNTATATDAGRAQVRS